MWVTYGNKGYNADYIKSFEGIKDKDGAYKLIITDTKDNKESVCTFENEQMMGWICDDLKTYLGCDHGANSSFDINLRITERTNGRRGHAMSSKSREVPDFVENHSAGDFDMLKQ